MIHPGFRLLRKGVDPRLGHLGVFRRLPPADADAAHDLPIRDDRQPTLPREGVGEGQDRVLPRVDRVLERLGWPFVGHRGTGFPDRDVGAGDLRLVQPLEVDQVPPFVDDYVV